MQNAQAQILIVDDEEGIRDLLRENLEEQGYLCYTAASGESALGILAAHSVDLALVDMMMPGMTGISLFGHMTDRFPDTAVIFDTAVDDLSLAVRQLKKGAYDYMVKPVSRKRLLHSVEEALSKRRTRLNDRPQGGDISASGGSGKGVATVSRGTPRPPRRLANIDSTVSMMFIDLEDSTQDLPGTLKTIIRRHIANHGGCEVNTMGDGLMMVFPGAKKATVCAVDIRRSLEECNGQYPGSQLSISVMYDWIKDPPGDIAQDLPGFVRLKLVPRRMEAIQEMLLQSMAKAVTDGVPVCEVIWGPAHFLRGFGLPLSEGDPQLPQ